MNDEYMIDVICDLTQVVYLTDTNRYMLITCMHCIVFFLFNVLCCCNKLPVFVFS